MNPEPSFDQIQIRMLQLGVDRDWLASQCDYKRPHINNILAPNGDPRAKTQKALRRMVEALDREEERQAKAKTTPIFERQQLVLRPTDEEFQNWCRASQAADKPVNLWALATLNDIAAAKSSRQAIPFKAPVHVAAAAAGPAIEAEVIETVDSVIRVRICGLSMDPMFADGDVIEMHSRIASRSPFMKKGLIYLVRIEGGYAVKRFNTRKPMPDEIGEEWAAKGRVGLLESVNPDFQPITIRSEIEWLAWIDPKELPAK